MFWKENSSCLNKKKSSKTSALDVLIQKTDTKWLRARVGDFFKQEGNSQIILETLDVAF